MRPLDPLGSIKTKLGVVIVAAVAVTVIVVAFGMRSRFPLWLVAIGAASLALAMVQLLARGMTSPLREMSAAARAMSKGDYDRRVTSSSKDEVGELARAFNAMAAELAETERIRRDLIANVSHDLRTPVSALQAVLENLIDGVASADDATLNAMLEQVRRLGGLVEQLLDLSRLEAGAVVLQPTEVPVGSLFTEAVRPFEMRGSDVSFETIVEPEGLRIRGDRDRLSQVLVNLLENAASFSPPGGRVVLRGSPAGNGGARLIVEDEGPGLPEGREEQVFQRFYRSDEARSRDTGGAGIGLAIARWIVELHGGSIRAESRSDRGTRFVVDIGGSS